MAGGSAAFNELVTIGAVVRAVGESVKLLRDHFAIRLEQVAKKAGGTLANFDFGTLEPAPYQFLDEIGESGEYGNIGRGGGGLVNDGKGQEIGAG